MRALVLLFFLWASACSTTSTVSSRGGKEKPQALLCRPDGKGPFPAVVYSHSVGVERRGSSYNLQEICRRLASDGFLAFIPIRPFNPGIGREDYPRQMVELSEAVDHVKTLPDVEPHRVALVGYSRGGLLALMVAVERNDLRALVVMAPATVRVYFNQVIARISSVNAPVLLLVEAGDETDAASRIDYLEKMLTSRGKEVRKIIYDRGGGHLLFRKVDYYWQDLRAFLQEKLGRSVSG